MMRGERLAVQCGKLVGGDCDVTTFVTHTCWNVPPHTSVGVLSQCIYFLLLLDQLSLAHSRRQTARGLV